MDELGLCPKFTTKDSHMSLARSRGHNGPTNPWNKPKLKATRNHNSRRKRLSSSARHQADSPRGRDSRKANRTSSTALKKGRSAPCPRTARKQLMSCGRSATSRQTVHETSRAQKLLAKRIETKALKNMQRTQRTTG
jgi:hypothetical protein